MIPDKKKIFESFVDQQRHFRAFSFQKSVRGNCRAHSNPRYQRCVYLSFDLLPSLLQISLITIDPGSRLSRYYKYEYLFENPANTFARGVVVVGRIHGEQFHHSNFPAWTPSVHVGKRAATIYGELEFITIFTHFYASRFTRRRNTRGLNLLD